MKSRPLHPTCGERWRRYRPPMNLKFWDQVALQVDFAMKQTARSSDEYKRSGDDSPDGRFGGEDNIFLQVWVQVAAYRKTFRDWDLLYQRPDSKSDIWSHQALNLAVFSWRNKQKADLQMEATPKTWAGKGELEKFQRKVQRWEQNGKTNCQHRNLHPIAQREPKGLE